MEQMDIVYSKGTEEIAQSMMSQIPAHHAADDNMKKFIYVMAETQAMFKLAANDLLASKRGSTVRDSELADMAENFNIQVDRNFMDKQKAFVQLASKWIDRKGTRLAFQTLISSYDKNSDISEYLRILAQVRRQLHARNDTDSAYLWNGWRVRGSTHEGWLKSIGGKPSSESVV